ncbi:hypothetical protein BpHYR1_050255 [Brachionus plicatilis]|uniref:Uncharacterized protein n=1 Tax=Brachionus plicatilis TaxID=10195 RepID=A0A3M7RVE8_BRAPC|nr:hypothetical protein BpHYR1_050255 [Brachionus plicatilis]
MFFRLISKGTRICSLNFFLILPLKSRKYINFYCLSIFFKQNMKNKFFQKQLLDMSCQRSIILIFKILDDPFDLKI